MTLTMPRYYQGETLRVITLHANWTDPCPASRRRAPRPNRWCWDGVLGGENDRIPDGVSAVPTSRRALWARGCRRGIRPSARSLISPDQVLDLPLGRLEARRDLRTAELGHGHCHAGRDRLGRAPPLRRALTVSSASIACVLRRLARRLPPGAIRAVLWAIGILPVLGSDRPWQWRCIMGGIDGPRWRGGYQKRQPNIARTFELGR